VSGIGWHLLVRQGGEGISGAGTNGAGTKVLLHVISLLDESSLDVLPLPAQPFLILALFILHLECCE